ncbi:OLC1v1032004C1 [Oldenlandia corymbosa var. corymbosa]|uniref:OLC1v1032004C1 n=1 Tax=Oldenlandia corymbosa var. corymbosa TaxID=529605 RepID=A0AAV1CN42_OLDCO|nr:OLC1v1032004C1 [Oldenlandia corymbosa var. corymbosa]
MGNSLGGKNKKAAKVMKINGETIKLKTPIYAGEVTKDHPGHVLLESEAVKHFGIRAKPLEPQQELKPKRLYFLVELPKIPEDDDHHQSKLSGPRRVRSGIQMSAKDRLESLMLARRSASDLTLLKPSYPSASIVLDDDDLDHHHQRNNINNLNKANSSSTTTKSGGRVRVTMRLPKSQVEKMMMESKDEAEAAAKIVDFCLANNSSKDTVAAAAGGVAGGGNYKKLYNTTKSREKRVGFMPFTEGEIQIAVS